MPLSNSDLELVIGSPFLIFTIIHGYFIYISFKKLRFIKNFQSNQKIAKYFYIMIVITNFFLFITSLTIVIVSISFFLNNQTINPIVESLRQYQKIIAILFYLPDFTFYCLFAFLFSQLLLIIMLSYIKMNTKHSIKIRTNLYKFIIVSIALGIISQLIIILLYSFDILTADEFSINQFLVIIIPPLFIITAQIYFAFNLSGLPCKSLIIKEKKSMINKVVLFWILSHILHGIINIVVSIIDFNIVLLNPVTDKNNNIKKIFIGLSIIVIDRFFVFILTIYLVFNQNFIINFFSFDLLDFRTNNKIDIENLLNDDSIESNINYNEKRPVCETLLKSFDFSKVLIGEDKIVLRRNAGLGKLIIGNYIIDSKLQYKVIIREIKVKVSNYILDEISNEITTNFVNNKEIKNYIVFPKAYNYDEELTILKIAYRYFENKSLGALLKSGTIKKEYSSIALIENNLKIRISLDIAIALEKIHNKGFFHGHLTPFNIMLDNNFKPKISDFCFNSLLKYCSLIFGYCNKNGYTAPEILKEKGLVSNKPGAKSDVYSYGMILLEIFTGVIPFEKYSLVELKNLVVEQENRPKIPEFLSKNIADLIRLCWQQEEVNRPSFSIIRQILENF